MATTEKEYRVQLVLVEKVTKRKAGSKAGEVLSFKCNTVNAVTIEASSKRGAVALFNKLAARMY